MSYKYSQYLGPDFIQARKDGTGYSSEDVEKFVMNFEVHHALSEHMGITARGGVAASLYLGGIRRSEDIDLYVKLPTSDVEKIMGDFSKSSGKFTATPVAMDHYMPLLRYDVSYSSVSGGRGLMKMDFICDPDMPDLPTKTHPPGQDVFGFKTLHDIRSLAIGSLASDKLSSLDVGNIGYGIKDPSAEHNNKNLPKQIYDISHLLAESAPEDLMDAAKTFPVLTRYKIQHKIRHDLSFGEYAYKDALRNISKVLELMVNLDNTIAIDQKAANMFDSNFKPAFLKRESYDHNAYLEDVLNVWLFVLRLLQNSGNEPNFDMMAQAHAESCRHWKSLGSQTGGPEMRDLLDDWPEQSEISRKPLRSLGIRRVFLLHEIEHARYGVQEG